MIYFIIVLLVLVAAFLYACCKIASLSDNVLSDNKDKIQCDKIENRKSK